jgi:hypothetical protein
MPHITQSALQLWMNDYIWTHASWCMKLKRTSHQMETSTELRYTSGGLFCVSYIKSPSETVYNNPVDTVSKGGGGTFFFVLVCINLQYIIMFTGNLA